VPSLEYFSSILMFLFLRHGEERNIDNEANLNEIDHDW